MHTSAIIRRGITCPLFAEGVPNAKEVEKLRRKIRSGELDDAFQLLAPDIAEAPFSLLVREAIIEAVNRIIDVENGRGDIRRWTDRPWIHTPSTFRISLTGCSTQWQASRTKRHAA